jgi:hypothetical protein
VLVPVDTTVSLSYIIDILNDFPAPIVAEEPPLRDKLRDRTQAFGGYLQLLPGLDSYQLTGGSAINASSQHRFGAVDFGRTFGLGEIEAVTIAPKRDPWLELTTRAIAAHRGLDEGWDNAAAAAPSSEALDTAELLAFGFTSFPVNCRPQFIVDTEGNPSFTLYNDNTYLHLTVEGPHSISWFRTVNGIEEFEDSVEVRADNAQEVSQRILLPLA